MHDDIDQFSTKDSIDLGGNRESQSLHQSTLAAIGRKTDGPKSSFGPEL
jgi:hypothetical protein